MELQQLLDGVSRVERSNEEKEFRKPRRLMTVLLYGEGELK